ncbi:leucine-rich repeat-containing protein 74A-like [Macrosteles quadrilineatus]|uniref:leucine-rich repeat-containing protein 74A-like n=1 Tax=Macrosteles quadrilineatus TaxID=74068 RepID=UPI0023E31BEF|nr:leucine-rich repeat-containing protein 74A-like [Macrosteles quadrilineatus]
MPIKRIVNSLKKSAINLQYYGLDCAQMKPLTETLMDNNYVKELNLKNNILNLDAMYHLKLLLKRNINLTTLNLSQCKITAEGIEMLGVGLEICPRLSHVDLSYNEFGDRGMEVLAGKLCYNTSITHLNVSHNHLTHLSGMYLAEAMEENYTLEHLDLSWNQISEEQGLKKFLYSAVEHNESILSLDLSWNTLSGEKVANVLKTFIGQHKTIEELNLSHNRFENGAELAKIAKGINTAQNLKLLDLSFNGMTADTAFILLTNLSTKAKLETLRLDNVWVKPEFEKLRKELPIQVITEGVSGGFGAKSPDMQTLLLKRAHNLGNLPKKPKNKKDFGWFLLRLQNTGDIGPVKKSKFEKLVVEDKIKFDEGMVNELAKRFRDDNKKVDLNLMLEKYLELYPNTTLPVIKESKKKKAANENKKKKMTDQGNIEDNLENEIQEAVETVEEIKESNLEITDNINTSSQNEIYEFEKSDQEIVDNIDRSKQDEMEEKGYSLNEMSLAEEQGSEEKKLKSKIEEDLTLELIETENQIVQSDIVETEQTALENAVDEGVTEIDEHKGEISEENTVEISEENTVEISEEKELDTEPLKETESEVQKWRVVRTS